MARSIENIFTSLSSINDSLTKVMDQAKKVSADSSVFDGEISRVLGEQLNNYFIPAIEKLKSDEATPGSIIGITQFLDSIPLAMARQGFAASEYNLPEVGVAETAAGIETPEGSAPMAHEEMPTEVVNEVDELPQNASFANPVSNEEIAVEQPVLEESRIKESNIEQVKDWEEFDDYIENKGDPWFFAFCDLVNKFARAKAAKDIQSSDLSEEEKAAAMHDLESREEVYYKNIDLAIAKELAKKVDKNFRKKKITESYSKYQVIRTSSIGSTLDEEIAKIEPVVVAEYDTEEEAKEAADMLNETVGNEEKDLLGTEYAVEKKDFNYEE